VGGRHFKFPLTGRQALRLFGIDAWSNVLLVGINQPSECIMNEINLAARLAQGFLAVTVVFFMGLMFHLSLVYS
jgi:hypothetical protein